MERANLSNAHLEGASLHGAHLDGAGMQEAFLDIATNLHDVAESTPAAGCISVADVRWGGINLAVISDWTPFTERRMVLGDERAAWTWKPKPFTEMPEQRKRPPRERRQAGVAHAQEQSRQRLSKFQEAARANRQFATTLRDQGMNEEADYFAYRAQVVQRAIFRQRHKRGRWLFSLFLDRIAGYGYKPERSLYTYLAVIAAFTGLYLIASFGVLTFGLHPTQVHSLQWYEALVLSVSSFHGRGFFQPLQNPGDPVAILAAAEAVFGLIIEVSFIATFTQRFFGR